MLFLIGAGFNVDAATEAGPIYGDCSYPLILDTARLCFDLSAVPTGRSLEDLFSEALARGDYSPVEKLADSLMKADYYLAHRLALSDKPNCYRTFFEMAVGSHFLTFNYDSLPETFLIRMGCWFPKDGYGMSVDVGMPLNSEKSISQESTSLVLHLHGSLCLYTTEFEVHRNPGDPMALLRPSVPRYTFDPDAISTNFAPYGRITPRLGHKPVERRVIAPVRNKAQGLREAFVRQTYDKALDLVRSSGNLVAIGYSFNTHDHASYRPILKALSETAQHNLLVVSPQARQVAERLRAEYPNLFVEAIEDTLRNWAAGSFRGLTNIRTAKR